MTKRIAELAVKEACSMPRISSILALVAVILLRAPAGWAQEAQILIPRVAASPTLDGRLDDWPATPQVVMADKSEWHPAASQYSEYGGPEDVSAEVRLAWDAQRLYLAIDERDDKVVRATSPQEIDRGDSIVLTLAPQGSDKTSQFVLALLKSSTLVWRTEPEENAGELKRTVVDRAVWTRAAEGGGWRITYEFSIPWSEIINARPVAGERMTYTVSVCDDDGGGLKGCLEHAGVVELSDSTTVLSPQQPYLAGPAALAPTFPAPNAIQFDKRRFLVQGHEALLFAGGVDYARVPKEAWASRLALLKSAGLNTVSLVVPWAHHQPASAPPDLAELREFLTAVGKAGLWAQVSLGPFAGEELETGGVPGWFLGLGTADRQKAADEWVTAVLAVVKEQQVTAGGPVISVLVRPLPDERGRTDAATLAHLSNLVRAAGMQTPVLTANAPAARDSGSQAMANLLDTVSFYTPPALSDLSLAVHGLAREENGPPAVALAGAYRSRQAARQSVDAARVALAAGATEVVIPNFAGGTKAPALRPNAAAAGDVLDADGLPTAGYAELRLLGSFLSLFGPQLAHAVPAEDQAKADDREVQVATRLAEKSGFIFVWDEKGGRPRQVRLTYNEPGTTAPLNIPEAGAMTLAPGGAKIIPIDVPVGRGTLRYSTSEVADLHRVGDRTLLVVYGDQDTPGEIALRWPGPPLVVGELLRQHWDSDSRLLVLDYFHNQKDQFVLVDDLQIQILSRERAVGLGTVGEQNALTLSTGARVGEGGVDAQSAKADLYLSSGAAHVTAAVPATVTAVLVDGKPVPFDYQSPARVLSFDIATDTYEQEQRPTSMLGKLGRIGRNIIGGAPKVTTVFDRAQFHPDAEAPAGTWTQVGALGRPPEALGLQVGQFARLRTRVDPGGRTTLSVTGAADPLAVFVNGKLVQPSGPAVANWQADIAPLRIPGENTLELLIQVLPRDRGVSGLRGPAKLLPQVALRGNADELVPDRWEVATGLAGEAAGWTRDDAQVNDWDVLKLGPWRQHGKRFADITGPAWYRFPFALPRPDAWGIPYEVSLRLIGNGELFLNGVKLASLIGSGDYEVPLPTPPLAQGDVNVLTLAVYDPSGTAGIERITVAADRERMVRKRQVEIRF